MIVISNNLVTINFIELIIFSNLINIHFGNLMIMFPSILGILICNNVIF
jgi:hypothetical protein